MYLILLGMGFVYFYSFIIFLFKDIRHSLSFSRRLILERSLNFICFSFFEKMNNYNTKRAVLLASAVLAAGAGGVWFYTW